jgi:hypothetical protein
MARITGRVEVLVNGEILLNKDGARATGLGKSGEPNYEKEAVVGNTLHGFKETFVPAMVEVTITDRDDVSLDKLARVEGDGTVIFRTSGGGKVYTMKNATSKGNFSLTAGEGETEIAYIGEYWVETTET